MGILGRLIGVIFHAFFRIVFTGLLFAIIGGGAALLVSFIVTKAWPPATLTIVAAVAIGVLSAYAASMTVLVGEAINAIRDAGHDVEKEIREVESKV